MIISQNWRTEELRRSMRTIKFVIVWTSNSNNRTNDTNTEVEATNLLNINGVKIKIGIYKIWLCVGRQSVIDIRRNQMNA